MLDRRQLMLGAAGLAASGPITAWAQDKFPSRPINFALPYAAGGGTDAIARAFADKLGQKIGGSVVVDNRPGAGGNIATDAVSAAAPDGYTLLMGNQGPMVVNIHMFKRMKNDPAQTLDPICLIADAGLVVVVNPKKYAFKTLGELLDEAKKRPGELNYGSASNGSASHLATLMLAHVTGIKARHVPYRGAAPAINDLLGNHIDFMITTTPSVLGQITGGTLTALAVTSEARVSVLPDVPTAIEAGVKGYVAAAWYGLLGPKGLPNDVRKMLEAAALDVLKSPDLVDKLKLDGAAPTGLGADAFAAFMAKERATWFEVIKAANLSLDG
jgi:tripartite-type tricarboxylate transporter receptor subunit TctC